MNHPTAKIGILTVSDRADSGEYADRSGPAIREYLDEVLTSPWTAVSRIVRDEQPLMRTSLLPGLLAGARRNVGRGAESVRLYEYGQVFRDVEAINAPVAPAGSRPNRRPSSCSTKSLRGPIPTTGTPAPRP